VSGQAKAEKGLLPQGIVQGWPDEGARLGEKTRECKHKV